MIEHAMNRRKGLGMLQQGFDDLDLRFNRCVEVIKKQPGRTAGQRERQKRAAEVEATLLLDEMRVVRDAMKRAGM